MRRQVRFVAKEFVKDWNDKRLSIHDIAKRHGIARTTARAYAKKWDLPLRETRPKPLDGLTPKVEQVVRDMWDDPTKTLQDIANKSGCVYEHVRIFADKLELGPRPVLTNKRQFSNVMPKAKEPWPKDMPRFEDYKPARNVGQRIFIRG